MDDEIRTAGNPVLASAYHIVQHASHVRIQPDAVEATATSLLASLTAAPYTPSAWGLVPLHPTPRSFTPLELLHWIFLASGTLNFSFWSDRPAAAERFGVRWHAGVDGKQADDTGGDRVWTGYWSLLAALHRAREDGVEGLLAPAFWRDADPQVWRTVFRSDQSEQIPLLEERCRAINDVGTVLCDTFQGSYLNLLLQANHSALTLVDLLVTHFPATYDDRAEFAGRPVVFRKRAQILVAETWAAFEGKGWGQFDDIDQLTMFADYRVPQILHSLGTLSYSPDLVAVLTTLTPLAPGSPMEVEIRGASIAVVEDIRRALVRRAPEGMAVPNAVLLDFLLWDLAKSEEGKAELPHHRTRSIWY